MSTPIRPRFSVNCSEFHPDRLDRCHAARTHRFDGAFFKPMLTGGSALYKSSQLADQIKTTGVEQEPSIRTTRRLLKRGQQQVNVQHTPITATN